MNTTARGFLALCVTVLAASVLAQSGQPGVSEMIEQLRPPTRTRSLRNILPEAAQPRPSVSLEVHFDLDSARLRPESEPVLENLATALQSEDLAASRFAVEGHTDATGRADYNLKLSERRAESVRAFLMQHGVAAERLVASGKGSTDPANPTHPYAAENRRVRVVNLD